MISKSKIFEVYEEKGRNKLFTLNFTPGKKAYEEQLVNQNNIEYREWDPYTSKLAALIANKCQNIFIRKDDVVLYLGSSTGTTVSHVSDIVGKEGFVFAVDLAPRVMTSLIFNLEGRKNIAPILESANHTGRLSERISVVDIIYQDIAQKDQLNIFLKNIHNFLKKDGYALLAVKARSIDVTRKPKEIFNEVKRELEKETIVIDYKTLEPYQKDHAMFVVKRK
ncbi:fibrillarin-like rRNA/tRNA 2'-O-methyltransferase [Candidatus Woesearchaeota archaeon]|nr:fibrillarin-like rRNA/tRNA 2'-O-methyltransferase [Candidatus Woesearchaeota archaeon]